MEKQGLKSALKAKPLPDRISAEEYRNLTNPSLHPAKHKFGAVRVVNEDGNFDSTGEQKRFVDLKWSESVGHITDLKRQVRIPLTCNDRPVLATNADTNKKYPVVYVADYTYYDCIEEIRVVEDFKGADTQNSRLKRAILATMPSMDGVKILVSRAERKKPKRKKRR